MKFRTLWGGVGGLVQQYVIIPKGQAKAPQGGPPAIFSLGTHSASTALVAPHHTTQLDSDTTKAASPSQGFSPTTMTTILEVAVQRDCDITTNMQPTVTDLWHIAEE
ncbi:hypothetical protein Ancab_023493 [Ancistrocladus abbreviatus]